MITKTLQEAFFERLFPIVREELPHEEPQSYTTALSEIAIAHNLSVEEAERWLTTPLTGKSFSTASFYEHACELQKAKLDLEAYREPAPVWPCPQCGSELQRLGCALVCSWCGEEVPA